MIAATFMPFLVNSCRRDGSAISDYTFVLPRNFEGELRIVEDVNGHDAFSTPVLRFDSKGLLKVKDLGFLASWNEISFVDSGGQTVWRDSVVSKQIGNFYISKGVRYADRMEYRVTKKVK